MVSLTTLTDETKIVLSTLSDRASSLISPNLRLGVTGLSGAGKTVFITSLVHNLTQNGRLPMLIASREGRIIHVTLEQQPDDAVARFEYESHLGNIINDRIWPQSTKALSEIRLDINFIPKSSINRKLSRGKISIDLIDYPGEWLLDLPLLSKNYREFSAESIERAKHTNHLQYSKEWLADIQSVNMFQDASDMQAELLSNSFKDYLRAAKSESISLSMLPPGRFLMPGDYDGTPLLTFSPLPNLSEKPFPKGSLAAMMERRYESYKNYIVKPFFREHIARLDRQIILIDTMRALNADIYAIQDLQNSLTEILSCYRSGRNSWFNKIWQHRISRILVATTKADHLHHENHDRLQHLTQQIVANSLAQAGIKGAKSASLAMASIRSTQEGVANHSGEDLPIIIGTPMQGEKLDHQSFDGNTQAAIFPGDLPENINDITKYNNNQNMNFIRFRPPQIPPFTALPHIRLDRALEFLIGDYLK